MTSVASDLKGASSIDTTEAFVSISDSATPTEFVTSEASSSSSIFDVLFSIDDDHRGHFLHGNVAIHMYWSPQSISVAISSLPLQIIKMSAQAPTTVRHGPTGGMSVSDYLSTMMPISTSTWLASATAYPEFPVKRESETRTLTQALIPRTVNMAEEISSTSKSTIIGPFQGHQIIFYKEFKIFLKSCQ